jgi:very-short-patch-repair endonuclease
VKKNIITKYEQIMMDLLDKKWIEYKSQFVVHTPRSFYTIDLYIPRYRICIEIDWKIHETPEKKEADLRRDNFLRSRWLYVVRIQNHEVRSKGWGKLWYLQKCLDQDYE